MMEARSSLPGLTAAGVPLSSAGAGGGSAGAWPVARPAMVANTGAITAAPLSKSLRFIGGIVAEGRAMAGMLAVFAEFKREILSERVRAGLAEARPTGQRLGRPPT